MAAKAKKERGPELDEFKWPFGTKNYLFFGLALLTIILGYIALGQGSITLAPILLIVGYCVLVPVALIIRDKPEEEDSETAGPDSE